MLVKCGWPGTAHLHGCNARELLQLTGQQNKKLKSTNRLERHYRPPGPVLPLEERAHRMGLKEMRAQRQLCAENANVQAISSNLSYMTRDTTGDPFNKL
jgi:hypothetical protein